MFRVEFEAFVQVEPETEPAIFPPIVIMPLLVTVIAPVMLRSPVFLVRLADEAIVLLPVVTSMDDVLEILPVPSIVVLLPVKIIFPLPLYVPLIVRFPVIVLSWPLSVIIPPELTVRFLMVLDELKVTVCPAAMTALSVVAGTQVQSQVFLLDQLPDCTEVRVCAKSELEIKNKKIRQQKRVKFPGPISWPFGVRALVITSGGEKLGNVPIF
jgi:hypothetical protein